MPCVNREVVENIFRSLRGRFGNAFVDKFRSGDRVPDGLPHAGKDVGLLEAMDVWAHELRQLSLADIEHGLKAKFKYPPSADEFVQACCLREIRPPSLQHDQAALPAPTLTREEAAERIAKVESVASSKRFPRGNGVNLDWARTIANETAQGNYIGGVLGKSHAAIAFRNAGKPVPESLVPYLPKANYVENEEAA